MGHLDRTEEDLELLSRPGVTFNEPNVYVTGGYLGGLMPPGKKNLREGFAAYANILLFSVVSPSNFPILANGDFHKAQHLYSWKTLLPCEKDVEAVKACIRDNRGVAITLFRNGTSRE